MQGQSEEQVELFVHTLATSLQYNCMLRPSICTARFNAQKASADVQHTTSQTHTTLTHTTAHTHLD